MQETGEGVAYADGGRKSGTPMVPGPPLVFSSGIQSNYAWLCRCNQSTGLYSWAMHSQFVGLAAPLDNLAKAPTKETKTKGDGSGNSTINDDVALS